MSPLGPSASANCGYAATGTEPKSTAPDQCSQLPAPEKTNGGDDDAGTKQAGDRKPELVETAFEILLPGQKKKEEGLVLVGNVEGESLQERFMRFKKERARERALAKRCATRATKAGVRDVERLRARFVETCKSYLGVPYGRKGHDPDEPEYNAPLFLDCCGLVRRAVQDLQEDFGFTIGRSNQAYQFETLPKELTPEELKPGDLVFVEATYFDPKKKPQRHSITHVEVFLGGETGEATIGSRWSRSDPAEGKVRGVQIHPSYKFVSKQYEIHKYHLRSLDTWLHGTCRSTSYPDATAGTAAVSCGGKSIFEDEEEAASDDEEGGEKGAFTPNPYGESPVFYVGEGNNWKVVAAALEARGWRRLGFEAGFSTRFDLKWVEQRGKIDYHRHLEGQLVNHIPNNDVITSKMRFLDTMRAHEEATGGQQRFPYHPSSYSSERAGEKLAALAEAEASSEAVWILKPSRGLGGNGIEMVKGVERLREKLFPPARDLALDPAPAPKPREGWVIQRYVERPLLLQGRKFDMRAYCIVARTAPQHLWFFHPGYCKVALTEYDPSDLESRFSHLTNACVQKTHPEYREQRGKHIWSEKEAEEELVRSGRWAAEKGPFWPQIHEHMKKALVTIFEASRQALERRRGYFDLLGIDFMLDEDLKPYLLEVNSNPAIWFDSSPTLTEMVPRLVGGTLELVLEAQRPGEDGQASEGVPAFPEPFELIVNEAAGYLYGKE